MYLRGTNAFPVAWVFVSVGIRKAQDVGAHRKKIYRADPNVDDELWKRAFWHLVVFDRIGAMILGRACSIAEEEFVFFILTTSLPTKIILSVSIWIYLSKLTMNIGKDARIVKKYLSSLITSPLELLPSIISLNSRR